MAQSKRYPATWTFYHPNPRYRGNVNIEFGLSADSDTTHWWITNDPERSGSRRRPWCVYSRPVTARNIGSEPDTIVATLQEAMDYVEECETENAEA